MATQRTSFAKLQRDRDRQVKAAAKRERRQNRAAAGEATEQEDPEVMLEGIEGELSAAELLKLVESVHQRFEAGVIDFETFENTKTELLSRLPVD